MFQLIQMPADGQLESPVPGVRRCRHICKPLCNPAIRQLLLFMLQFVTGAVLLWDLAAVNHCRHCVCLCECTVTEIFLILWTFTEERVHFLRSPSSLSLLLPLARPISFSLLLNRASVPLYLSECDGWHER